MSLKRYFGANGSGLVVLALVLVMSCCMCLSASASLVDTFSRADSTDLGTSEDAGAYTWFETSDGSSQILGGMLSMPMGGNVGPDLSSGGTPFRPSDFDFTATVIVDWPAGAGQGAIGVCYRQANNIDPGYGNGGYMAFIFGNGAVTLFQSYSGLQHIGQTPIATAPDWSVPHSLRVRASGNHHEAWFDGQKIIDYIDLAAGAVNGPGYLYMTPSSVGAMPMRWDDINIVIPEPASMLALLCGLGGLFSLRRRSSRS